ncbi:MAG: hypothetical protein M1819_002667 [Sarea resinae]|nr:MAG: hypothetical protein M1819_002667 [Sarea resinae]
MFKPLSRRTLSWTCSQCVSRQQFPRRLATAATATTAANHSRQDAQFAPATHGAPGASHDDRTLRAIFDSQPFWREFSQRKRPSVGLFRNRYLTGPKGFQDFAAITLQKCRKIVAKVLAASSVEEYKHIARDLDRLSDLLCRVIDLSDFVRSTHPDRRIQAAATQAYALMFEYMNVLNTTTGLNDQLKVALANPEVADSWSEEEKVVARILMKDFSKSAIDLPASDRQKFIDLSNDISQLGSEFVDNMEPETPYLEFESNRLRGMDPLVVRKLTKWGKVTLPAIGPAATLALRSVEDESTRKQIYMANRTASRNQIHRLDELLKKRAELAKLSGYSSYGDMALGDKMAKSAKSVDSFLQALVADNHSKVQQELKQLVEVKQTSFSSGQDRTTLNAWDRDFCSTRLLSRARSRSRAPDFLSAYFSLGTVMQGLSRLFTRLYGIRLVPHETSPGETWNDEVRRLDVIDEHDGHIAVVYCDLFEREGKNPNPAHFTLRCSRQITEAEIEEGRSLGLHSDHVEDITNDGMAAARDPHNGKLYQLPTIALICDFHRPTSHNNPNSNRPVLLSFREVQTLFHEMGHAVHSMLGRTTLQNVAGTRCATDFAELPSVLMEHFASSPAVLALFARHWETDAALPYGLVADKVALEQRLSGSETEAQILLAMLDQSYHSARAADGAFSSSAAYHDIYNAHASLPEPAGTSWQGFFGHLYGYGASYYSYLFDRAIAGKIWKEVFQNHAPGAGGGGGSQAGEGQGGGPVSREAGERYRREVLSWGGGRDGWKCVAGVLGDERLAEGGPAAMAEVGKWGAGD